MNQNYFHVYNSRLVTLRFPTDSDRNVRYYMPNEGILNEKRITGFRICTRTDVAASYNTGDPFTVITNAQLAAFTVSLIDIRGLQVISEAPAYTFASALNGGIIRRINGLKLNISACYIRVLDGSIPSTSAVLFEFFYR